MVDDFRTGLRTDEFDYDLPEERIGQVPVEPRHDARLLVDRGPGPAPDHRRVRDLPAELDPGDVVVVNDTRVLPARLPLHKATGGAAEVLLLEPTGRHREWRALVRPSKRLAVGQELFTSDHPSPVVVVGEPLGDGRRLVEVLADDVAEQVGQVPLPPYITAPLADPERYQTVFARHPGSVAAPTAGLHLTDQILGQLADKGVGIERIELQVGLGTFRPVGTDRVEDHVMHAETYHVDPAVWDRLLAAREAGGRIIAVGTTVVRTLESVALTNEFAASTELFIRRGFDWKMVDVLMTNFHVPRSSLLVLVDAFVGPRWRELYETAIDEGYRMLSFGDAMLIRRSADREPC